MHQMIARRLVLALVLTFPFYSITTQADERICEDDLNLSPWLSAITSNFVDGGATGDPVNGYTLCSSAPGPGDELDSTRLLVQSAGGDFSFETLLTSLTGGGSGGVVVTLPGLDLVSAPRLLMWVEADAADPTKGTLYGSLRRDDDGQAEALPPVEEVSLPLHMHLSRSAGFLTAGYYDDDPGILIPYLTADVAGEALGGTVRMGMAQFSADDGITRFAHFQRMTLESATAPDLDCVEGSSLLPGDKFTVYGKNMDQVTGAVAFGSAATIETQTPQYVIIDPQFPPGSVNYGRAEISSNASRYPILAEISSIGTPFVRGDANLDGKVDRADARELQAWMLRGVEPACPGAGDVNGDTFTNMADLEALNAWLDGSGRPPAAPFPHAGLVRGSYTCATPAAPDIRSIKLAPGERSRAVVEGDVLELKGKDLPPSDELIVWFGDVRTRSLDGDDRKIKVMVGEVPSDGPRCARIIHARSQPPGEPLRVGGGWLATEKSSMFCHDFRASDGRDHGFVSQVARDGSIEIPIPRDDWQPGQSYDIDATAFLPWLDGLSSGSRAIQMSFLAPRASGSGFDEYTHGLEALAKAMTNALNGGYQASTPCDCEVEVVAVPGDEKLILAPCFPPPPAPEPVAPGPNQWKPPPPNVVGGVKIKANNPPPFECDGEFVSHKDDARKAAWCHFRDVVQPITEESFDPPFLAAVGHPEFAAWKPLSSVVDSQYGGMDQPWIVAPDDQPLSMKHILFEPEADSQLSMMNYNDPHTWFLRQQECAGFESRWTPKISFGHRIAKTFFVSESMLPSSVSTAGLYSYIPPGSNERHYLVGLHLAISTLHDFGATPDGYFWWATFWVPAANNDTQTKGGQDLEWTYSPTCTVGNGLDRPLDLPPPWNRFVMCTDATGGHEACGNPYAFGECPLSGGATSCTSCHAGAGKSFNTQLNMGWLPSIATALSAQDLEHVSDYLDAHPGEFTWWTQPTDGAVPNACHKSNLQIWNPFDPNDLKDDGEG